LKNFFREHHLFRDHDNLVIPIKFQKKKLSKKEKIAKKNTYHHYFKTLIVTSKVFRRRHQRSIDRKGILSRASQRKHQRGKKQCDQTQLKEVQQSFRIWLLLLTRAFRKMRVQQ
jgi:hypothetical protein